MQLNNYRHAALQKSAGSWISPHGFWNRHIVCLHAGRRLGQTVPSFQDFKLKTGKKREKEGKGGKRRLWFGAAPEEFPVYRECPATRGKEMP